MLLDCAIFINIYCILCLYILIGHFNQTSFKTSEWFHNQDVAVLQISDLNRILHLFPFFFILAFFSVICDGFMASLFHPQVILESFDFDLVSVSLYYIS